MSKWHIKLCKRFFSHKINKDMQIKPGMKFLHFCTFLGMTSLASDSNLCNFITSWELIKTLQISPQGHKNFYAIKTKVNFWSQVPFKNLEIQLAESSLDHIQIKICKPSFMFFEPISSYQKSSCFIDFFLRSSWFQNPAIHEIQKNSLTKF